MKDNQYSKYFLKRLLIIPLFIVTLLIRIYAKHNPTWTETIYSQYFYPKITFIIGFFPSKSVYSIFEWVACLLLILLLIYVYLFFCLYTKKSKERSYVLYHFLTGVLSFFCFIYILFTFTCGLNYFRHPFINRMGIRVQQENKVNMNNLENLIIHLSSNLEEIKFNSNTNEEYSFKENGLKSIESMELLSKKYPVLDKVSYTIPKPLLSSKLFSKAGIAGIFVPFTFESNINTDLPEYVQPSTMAHELVHQAGFMREDEANFVSYLACVNHPDNKIKYSGYFLAFTQSMYYFETRNPEKAKVIESHLSKSLKEDYLNYKNYIYSQKGYIQDISNKINNTYLKSNSQKNGIQDYNRMIHLLLLEFNDKKLY